MTCFVKNCKNARRLLMNQNVSFHMFPVIPEIRDEWLRAIGRNLDELVLAKKRFVCSEHFFVNDYEYSRRGRVLKFKAIPCVIKKEAVDANTSIGEVVSQLGEDVLRFSIDNMDSSSNFESSTGTRKMKRIRIKHSYSLPPSKILNSLMKTKYRYQIQKQKLRQAQEAIRRLKKKVVSLKEVIKNLKTSDSTSNHLQQILEDIPNNALN